MSKVDSCIKSKDDEYTPSKHKSFFFTSARPDAQSMKREIKEECVLSSAVDSQFTKDCTDAVLRYLIHSVEGSGSEADIDEEQFHMGMNVELEHGTKTSLITNITADDPIMTGKIALAHLLESPTYYTHLYGAEKAMDKERELMTQEEKSNPWVERRLRKYASGL